MRHLGVQLIGTVGTVVTFLLIAWIGPKVMFEVSWRFEMLNYEQKRSVGKSTLDLLHKNAEIVDRVLSMSNVSNSEIKFMVQTYADESLPNASVLVAPGEDFKTRWNESNTRGALLESAMMADSDIIIFPANESFYVCTIVSLFIMVPATMLCASMIAVYQRLLMSLVLFLTGQYKSGSFESPQYVRSMVAREVIALALSTLFALFCLAQASVFGWLESDKTWKMKEIAFWGSFLFTGIAHSPDKPSYMLGFPQMSNWLSLCHFCMCLHTSASIGLVIAAAIRCYQARDALKDLPLTDEEIRTALAIDHKRVANIDANRPLYHN